MVLSLSAMSSSLRPACGRVPNFWKDGFFPQIKEPKKKRKKKCMANRQKNMLNEFESPPINIAKLHFALQELLFPQLFCPNKKNSRILHIVPRQGLEKLGKNHRARKICQSHTCSSWRHLKNQWSKDRLREKQGKASWNHLAKIGIIFHQLVT